MLKLESFYSRQLAQIDNPLLTSLVINKFTKMGAEDYYAKKESVETYPEYLFRMDDEQKWTKENTHENICVLPAYITQPFDATAIECINNYFVYSFNDREILYQNLLDWQKKQFSNPLEKPEKYMKHAKDRIRFYSMVYEEDKESLADEMIVELDKIAKSSINFSPICAVSHLDEDYPHIHILYMLDPTMTLSNKDLKAIPHIDNLYTCSWSKDK